MRKAVVHIIESPSAEDFFNSRHEGSTLKAALTHAGVPATLRTVVDFKHFVGALVEVMSDEPDTYPIVHFSMHGNATGVCLTSNEVFDWKALGGGLCDVNDALGGMLLVSMSTCSGFEGIAMAHRDDGEPFFALVGPQKSISWADTLASFTSFYHHIVARDGAIVRGVELMNGVLGEELFACKRADDAKKEWQVARIKKEMLQRIAERVAKSTQPGTQQRSEALRELLART